MGGGRGGGFFAGTDGWRASEAFARGTLVADAARNTATDAGGASDGILDALRPWWSYPYGHPEKTKNIKLLQGLVKSEGEKMGSGFINHPDAQNYIMKNGVILLKELITNHRQSRKKKNK